MSDANELEVIYGERMRSVRASAALKERVLCQARSQRQGQGVRDDAQEACAGQNARAELGSLRRQPPLVARPSKGWRGKRGRGPRRPGLVLGGLAAAMAVAALAVALPGADLKGAGSVDSPFVVQAYGGVEDPLLPNGRQGGRVVFNCETETQRYVPMGESYENEGCYTGCMFSVRGEGIVRLQADVSVGELYRMESVEYTLRSDPELAQELASWKPTAIGQGELLGKYDLVKGVLYYEAVEGGANDGRLRGDPDTVSKANLYQRLGRTIDVTADAEPETPLTDYAFGLWTNEPFERGDDPSGQGASLDRALDTLDGAMLTVTVTFADGSCATQVISLHAANFKAESQGTTNGYGVVTELTPEMLAEGTRAEQGTPDDASSAGIHTLYGTVERVSPEPFPCGGASHPSLEKPLTEPMALPEADVSAYDAAADSYDGHAYRAIGSGDVLPLGASWRSDMTSVYEEPGAHWRDSRGAAMTVLDARLVDGLPEGVGIRDLHDYYSFGGYYDDSLESIEVRGDGYRIEADGSLSEGWRYLMLDVQVANESGRRGEVFLGDVVPVTLAGEPGDDGAYDAVRCSKRDGNFTWRSHHEKPGWDTHVLFDAMDAGEVRTYQLLFVVPEEAVSDDGLGVLVKDQAPHEERGSEERWRVLRIGALA